MIRRKFQKLGDTIRQHSYLHHYFVLAIDVACSVLAGVIACLNTDLFFDTHNSDNHLYHVIFFLFLLSLTVFLIARFYRVSLHHINLSNLPRLFLSVAIVTTGFFGLCDSVCLFGHDNHICDNTHAATLSALIYFIAAICLIIGVRILIVSCYNFLISLPSKNNETEQRHIFVYGEVHAAANFAEFIRNAYADQFIPVGIIDPETKISKLVVNKLPVYGEKDMDLLGETLKTKYSDSDILMFRKSLRQAHPQIVEWCTDTNIRMYVVPPIENCAADSPLNIRPVSIDDLLERPEICIEEDKISEQITGKCVMVTGAAGSIGSELVRQLCKFEPSKIILLDNAETPLHNIRLEMADTHPELNFVSTIADVRNKSRCADIVAEHRPEIIFHAAAYKHVPLMEENPCEAVLANVRGSINMADLAREYQVSRFVMVSTDKAVNPTNVMGATKRAAEMYVQTLDAYLRASNKESGTQYITTRFGNVLGSNGSVVPRFREQIAKGGPVTVTHPDIIRFFMTIPEACRLVLQAAIMGDGGEIFVFDMGEPVKIANLARRMILLSGFQPEEDIQIVYTGLRPGEKLYEEVLSDKETTIETYHSKIKIARACSALYDAVASQIRTIITTAETRQITATVMELKTLIPEFKSKNSPFEALDHSTDAHVSDSHQTAM